MVDPVVVMSEWKPNEADFRRFKDYVNDLRGQCNPTIKVDPVTANIIKTADLLPDESGLTFEFNIELAPKWLGLISTTIKRLRVLMAVGTNASPDRDALLKVDNLLRFLGAFLKHPVLNWLFTATSLAFFFELKGKVLSSTLFSYFNYPCD